MWSLRYCLLIFIGVTGVIQLGAARNNLRGLFIFPWRYCTLGFGVLAVGFPLVAFFTWNEIGSRVIEGSQQAGSFVLSAAASIIFTVLFSSLLNFRRLVPGVTVPDGMDALKDCTVFQVLYQRWSHKAR
jgi:hypothetical protein